MHTDKDLLWTKNVKRDKGHAWAYMEFKEGDAFYLNFSKKFKASAYKAKPGQAILLFQTINKQIGNISKGTYLTHIVTPIDEIITEEANSNHPFKRMVGVLSHCHTPINKPISYNFHKPNRGALCSIDLIEKIGTDISITEKQSFFWSLFSFRNHEVTKLLKYVEELSKNPTYDDEFEEGEVSYLIKKHKFFERNKKLIENAKSLAKQEDRLFCEVCSFDFSKHYPTLGDNFIECHHKLPIASGGIRKSKIKDIALVCSNCHRMLHRKLNGKFLSTDELKEIIMQRYI